MIIRGTFVVIRVLYLTCNSHVIAHVIYHIIIYSFNSFNSWSFYF